IGGPGDFIPLIEKAGMMKDLDNLVVRKAFYDMEMKIGKKFGLSINLSAGQFSDPSYGEFLSLFAKQHGIEPDRVVLEITESTLVDNIDLARENMVRLKENGFLIAIDDFGKGFSSLTYLVELPIDILKIDMAFVQAVPGDERKEKVAKYIMDLGRALGLKVLAEGFELPEQVEFFRNYGCALFQGYYFSRPLPLADLLEKYPS
ncbi:MAG TPA: EAL domain-containing protein, partial [Spirochaetota bacterium]|nr:EAL domain-containing protein [Spirochaetota bacterium]